MKTSTTLLTTLVIAALTGLAIAILGNVLPSAALSGDTALAILFTVAFALNFARDFSRRSSFRPLADGKPAPLLRPTAPIFLDARRATSAVEATNDLAA